MKGILKDALTLLCITLVAGLCLSFVYELTKEPIAQAELQKKYASYQAVMENVKFSELSEEQHATLLASSAHFDAAVDEVLAAKDNGNNLVGFVMSATSKNGYGGEIKVAIGVSTDGKVTGFSPLSHGETPGFGARMENDDVKAMFVGISSGAEFDGISGATITSTALRQIVDTAVQTAEILKGAE